MTRATGRGNLKIRFLLLFTVLVWTIHAQNTVTGIIADESGEPLIGASVVIEGTTSGTTSDIDGTYSLSGLSPESVLIFSYTGMTALTETVGTRSVVDVILKSAYLEEIVVTALGIEREERSLGYSVGSVSGEELNDVSQENVLSSLSGRVPGVTINQTSGPGSSMSIIIRGATSLTTDNQPLFVVDGVPMSNSLNNVVEQGSGNQVDYGNAISDISPDDIEDISVLKGPSAAALYGTRAGNGVIIITTKSGSRSKSLGVSFSTSNVFERPTRLLDFHYKYANGERSHIFEGATAYWGGPELDVGNRAVQWPDGEEAELRSYPDNMKEFLQTGITSTNNLAIAGGGEKGTYRVAFSNMSHRGMIPNSDLYRNGLSTALNFDILDNLTFNANINVARQNSNDRPSTGDRRGNALQSVYESSYIDVRKMENYWVTGQEEIQHLRPPQGDNPYFVAFGINNGFERDRLYGSVSLTYDFTENLSLTLRQGLDRFNESRETKIPWSYSRMRKGGYYLQDLLYQEANSDLLATYNKDVNDFSFVFSAGGNIMKRLAKNSSVGVGGNRHNGLVIPGLYTVRNIPVDNTRVGQSFSEKSIQSVYALASIGFQNMLYLDLSGRNDWSSTLPSDNNSYFYPSASLSWLINYAFDMPQEVSLFKARAGWAQVGNDTDPYQLEATLSSGTYNSLNTLSVPSSLLNADLKPELATSIEFGIDLNLYRDRIRFSGTYYTVDNENQIFGVNLPRSSGYSSRVINAGLVRSSGWEIALGGTPISSAAGLVWDVNLHLTTNTTTIEELADGLESLRLWGENGAGAISKVGEKIGDLYSRGYLKVEDPNSPYFGWPILADGGQWERQSNLEDLIKVGNFNPDALVGMQTSLSYKRFSLNASLDWRIGGEFMSFTYRYGESDWRSQRQLDQVIPGSNFSTEELVQLLKSNPEKYIIPQTGNFPRVGGHTAETGGFPYEGGNDGAFVPGVYVGDDGEYVENLGGPGTILFPITDTYPWSFNQQVTFDASFIKMRELSLGWQLPKIKGINDATFSVYTRNLILWTKADIGIDPERAYQANGGKQGDIRAVQFKQGLERQNVMPWSFPIGFKLACNF